MVGSLSDGGCSSSVTKGRPLELPAAGGVEELEVAEEEEEEEEALLLPSRRLFTTLVGFNSFTLHRTKPIGNSTTIYSVDYN